MSAVVEVDKTESAQPKDVEAVVVAVAAPTGPAMDYAAFANLANNDQFEFKQGNALWEAISGGCVPNTYTIRPYTSAQPDQEQLAFLMQEESSCWCRACCNPAQPALIKFRNSGPPKEKLMCSMVECKKKPYNTYSPVGEPVLTMEKNGNCDNCAQCGPTNCFVCCAKCQSKTWLHIGDVKTVQENKGCGPCKVAHWEFPEGTPGLADNKRPNVFAEATVPIMGGGCTPTVNVMRRGVSSEMEQFAVIEGPTCFGGCMDLCCNTEFKVSRGKGKAGDLAVITKQKPDGFMELLIAMCTPVDKYQLLFTENHGLHPTEKAAIMSEMVHLDFLFFEAEQPLCEYKAEEKMCYILLCTCYCFGCLCPIKMCCGGSSED